MNSVTNFVVRAVITVAITWMIYTIAATAPVDNKDSKVWGEIAPVGVIRHLKPEYPNYPELLKSYRLRGCYYPCYKVA